MLPPLQEVFPRAEARGLPELDAALLRGAVVLTPTLRATRHCLQRYDAGRQLERASAWQAPVVLAWSAWISSLWRDAVVCGIESRVLLNSLQERALWKRVIAEQMQSGSLPSSAQLRLCASAVRLIGAYDVYGRFTQDPATGANALTFAKWYSRFEELCTVNSYLPAAFAEIELARHLLQGSLPPATEYILYGFGTLTPAQEHVLSALRETSAHVQPIDPHMPQRNPPRIVRCNGIRDEASACAAWARETLLSRPSATLAIVVPHLDAEQAELERELRNTIAPETSGVTQGEHLPRYEFSSGRPLNRLPMIADALRLLRWCSGDLPIQEIGALLRSPRLTLAPTPERGAELDAFVLPKTKALRAELSMHSIARALYAYDQPTANTLSRLAAAAPLRQKKATYAEHASSARDLLRTAGWLGRDLNSVEYQAADRWNDALDRLATLDLLGWKPTFAEALADLDFLAGEMLFAPENTDAPVQIISLSEAAGITADALWFLHADENSLTTRRSLHPLLPAGLQRHLCMPCTNSSDEEKALTVTLQHLTASTRQAIFSYASIAGESQQRLAPLLERLAETWCALYVNNEPVHKLASASPMLETVEDSAPLPALPPGTVHGGVSVITTQAQCAFRAFAEHRLSASAPQQLEAGYTYADRGDHIHKVLSAFWNDVGTQARLIQITNTPHPGGGSHRDALLRDLIGNIYKAADHAWDAAYLEVQRQRLFTLLSAWLEYEAKTRQPFTVLATEKEVESATLGPLQLNMRIDRIDTVETDGITAKLLIDYKAGRAEPREWFDERPDAPQLPIYAIAAGLEDVKAIAFGKVTARDKDRCLSGRGASPNPFGLKPPDQNFDVALSQWRDNLEQLASAFAEGDTRVDPKQYPQTCEFCQQRMLCRVEASKPVEVDDPPDEEAEIPEWQ